jgi:hypothetical protein
VLRDVVVKCITIVHSLDYAVILRLWPVELVLLPLRALLGLVIVILYNLSLLLLKYWMR